MSWLSNVNWWKQDFSSKYKNSLQRAVGRALSNRMITYVEAMDRQDVRVWPFGRKQEFIFEEPIYYNSLPDEIERLVGNHTPSKPYVLEIPDVTVVGGQGLLRTKNDNFIVHNLGNRSDGNAERRLGYIVLKSIINGTWPFTPSNITNTVPNRIEVATPFVDRWATNYYHWIADFLPKIEAIEYYREQTGTRPTILLPPNPPSFVMDSLELFGIESEQYREINRGSITVDRLVLPSYRQSPTSNGEDYLRDPESFRWLRDRLESTIDLNDSQNRRILISRQQDASTRRITNWREVQNELTDRDFEPIVKTEYSFIEQKQIFNNADVVVAPHGAGLADLVFGKNTKVIELFGSHIVPSYYELCEHLDHQYGCLLCEPRGDDIYVDIDELTTAIETMVQFGEQD